MKKAMAVLVQFLLFLVVFAVGSFVWHPFHVQTVFAPADRRAFQWDGVLLMLLTYLLLLSIAAARKRLTRSGLTLTLALILAALAGWLLKFGFISRDW
ncbi:MAG TPA: hypothetical protein VH250_13095 [Granulicella sp.]|nr:hypothetical protein [Granulicella sp.]